MRQEAEDSHTVVEADNDDALPGQLGAVIEGIRGRAADECATVDEDHDGAMCLAVVRGRPKTDGEAVLAGVLSGWNDVRCLHAVVAKVTGVPIPRPGSGRLRRTPAQPADWRGCVRNALEGDDPVADCCAGNCSCGGADDEARDGVRPRKT